jgi:AcrR family transcriptional regulator
VGISDALPTSPEPVWLRAAPERASRRAEPLSLDRIVDAVVAELDEHGAESLTMRRLARRLAVTSTALYWHVATKEDLLDLALDRACGEAPIPAADGEPRDAVRTLLVGWRAAMLAHPWSPSLLGRPLLGPNILARTEFLQATLTRTGLSGLDLASATRLLANYLIGSATAEVSWQRLDDPAVLPRARDHITSRADLYPTLSTSGFVEREWTDETLFLHGLDHILDAVLPLNDDASAAEVRAAREG